MIPFIIGTHLYEIMDTMGLGPELTAFRNKAALHSGTKVGAVRSKGWWRSHLSPVSVSLLVPISSRKWWLDPLGDDLQFPLFV